MSNTVLCKVYTIQDLLALLATDQPAPEPENMFQDPVAHLEEDLQDEPDHLSDSDDSNDSDYVDALSFSEELTEENYEESDLEVSDQEESDLEVSDQELADLLADQTKEEKNLSARRLRSGRSY